MLRSTSKIIIIQCIIELVNIFEVVVLVSNVTCVVGACIVPTKQFLTPGVPHFGLS